MTRPPTQRQSGYTLFEALAALGVASLALSLLLMIGMRGVGTGFRLGARAVSHADEQVSLQAIRDTLDAIVLPPIAIAVATNTTGTASDLASGQSQCDGICDDTFDGEATELVGHVIPMRETACVPLRQHAQVRLTIASANGRTQITCKIEDAGESRTDDDNPQGQTMTLADLSWPDAKFSYSEDGVNWVDSWTVTRGEDVEQAETPDAELRKVYVRIGDAAGTRQLIALVTSGRALAQARR